MAEKRYESRLPHVWIDVVRIREVALDGCDCVGHMSAKKVLHTDVEYVPCSTLASVTRERDARITELERLYETEQRHSSALMARINELTKEPSDGTPNT